MIDLRRDGPGYLWKRDVLLFLRLLLRLGPCAHGHQCKNCDEWNLRFPHEHPPAEHPCTQHRCIAQFARQATSIARMFLCSAHSKVRGVNREETSWAALHECQFQPDLAAWRNFRCGFYFVAGRACDALSKLTN